MPISHLAKAGATKITVYLLLSAKVGCKPNDIELLNYDSYFYDY